MIQRLAPEVVRAHKGISFPGVMTGFLVHDGQGEFFMARRSDKARDSQDTWEMGGGGLKMEWDADANAVREIGEEFGTQPLSISFLGYRDVHRRLEDGTPTHWVALYFAALVVRDEVRINEPHMFTDSGWFTLDNLPEPLHPEMPPFFEKFDAELRALLGTPAPQ